MQTIIEILLLLASAGVVWRLITKFVRPHALAELADEPSEPSAPVPVTPKKGPKGRSGAVALDEPEDDEGLNRFPPRAL